MVKQGGGTTTFSRKNWKRRWFILTPVAMAYYETDIVTNAKPCGTITLDTVTNVQFANEDGQHSMSVTTPARVYHFNLESEVDVGEWVFALGAARQGLADRATHLAQLTVGMSSDNLFRKRLSTFPQRALSTDSKTGSL
jgi:hypothetical protein